MKDMNFFEPATESIGDTTEKNRLKLLLRQFMDYIPQSLTKQEILVADIEDDALLPSNNKRYLKLVFLLQQKKSNKMN